jgi:hypothetical protein
VKLNGEAPGPFNAGLGAPAPCNQDACGSVAEGSSGTTGLENTESAAGSEGTGPGWPDDAGTGGKEEDGAANGDGGEPGAGAKEKGLGGGGVGSSGVDMMLGIGAGGAGGNGASACGSDHGLPPPGGGDEAPVDAVTAGADMKGEAGADGRGEEVPKPLAPGTPLAIWNGLPAPKLNGLGPPCPGAGGDEASGVSSDAALPNGEGLNKAEAERPCAKEGAP